MAENQATQPKCAECGDGVFVVYGDDGVLSAIHGPEGPGKEYDHDAKLMTR